MGRIRQGNSVLGAICRDIPYLIFKQIESMNIGASINIERTKTKNKQVAIVFADDTDFYVNGTNFESNMQ